MKKDNEILTGDAIWNISSGYVNLKLLKPIYELDELEFISKFGSKDFEEHYEYPTNFISQRRKDALFRLKDKLKQIIANVSFEIKRNSDKELLEILRLRILDIEKYIQGTYRMTHNQVNHTDTLIINEEFFNYILDELLDVKEKLNIPINNANLIFRSSDEVNLQDIIDGIVEGG